MELRWDGGLREENGVVERGEGGGDGAEAGETGACLGEGEGVCAFEGALL